MSKHTPGPWDKTLKKGDRTYIGSQEKPVAEICPLYGVESAANAHLIKAAPEMLEALENIENDDAHIPATIWDLIQKAIAKAKGGE